MVSNVTMANGLTAFQNATNHMTRAGDQIAKESVSAMTEGKKTDLLSPIVDLQQASLDAKAAVRLLEVEKQTSDYLLDVMA